MVRPRKTVFIIIVTCFICIPLVLQGGYTLTGKRYDIPLVGVASDTQAPKKSLQGFLEGSYQSDYEQWLNTNLIPRGVLVKLYNQIRYSLFNLGSEWIIGKNKDIIGLDSVSYTHLDVYKRQAPDCGRHSIGFQDKCFNKLKSIKACGTNIVIVSHSLGQIEEICDYSIWLKDRKLEMLGDPGRFTPAIWNYFRERKNHTWPFGWI